MALTRRGFLATTGASTGLGVLAAAGVTQNSVVHAADPGSTITSNFNGTTIAAGDFIWFNSVLKVHGLGIGSGHDWLRRIAIVRRERHALRRPGAVRPREFCPGSSGRHDRVTATVSG